MGRSPRRGDVRWAVSKRGVLLTRRRNHAGGQSKEQGNRAMRHLFFASLAAAAVGLAGPALGGDVVLNNTSLNLSVGSMTGTQQATASGPSSIAQVGLASVAAAGTANISLHGSTIHLMGSITGTGSSTATATGLYATAQAAVASIVAASSCNCMIGMK